MQRCIGAAGKFRAPLTGQLQQGAAPFALRPRTQRAASGRSSGGVRVMAGSRITGKTVVVTGAGRGIGLEFAKQFQQRGNQVIATVRQQGASKQLQDALGGDVTVMQLDVADPESVAAFAETAKGVVDHVDVLINNAGILIYSDLQSVSANDMLDCFRVNAMGPLLTSQALLNAGLLGGDRRSIIGNVTSKVGSNADNGSGGGYAYRASKAALNIINTSMSIDLKDRGVTSVLLHPGWVRTDMTSRNGLIDAAESAGGLISVLESGLPLNGHWYDYKHEEIPW
jgi:NAD(P)-dependent dehydrogenase (short-subunit alcohol dehydrogenase family)